MLHPIILTFAGAIAMDGDGFKVRAEWGWQPFRVPGVVAPELDEPGGIEARDFMEEAIEGQRLQCRMAAQPSFNRFVADCRILTGPWRTDDLGCLIVSQGHAVPAVGRYARPELLDCLPETP